jgi:FAD/FMN-containing dehydrogenase
MNEFLSKLQKGFPEGFLSTKKEDLDFYGRDWTLEFPANPSAVVFPKSTEEVAKILSLCSEYKIPVVPSGGRTGLSGGAVAPNKELVLSLSRMNKIGKACTLSRTLEVEAGAVTESVHEACKNFGLTWPVDFASKGSSQVGGNISTNAGGVNVIRHGNTRNWVLGLEVVTMQGQVLKLGGALEKNNSGIDLRQLFIGSEGILGVITKATLKLNALHKPSRVFFFGMKDLASVFRLCSFTRESPLLLSAYETLDGGCLNATCQEMQAADPFAKKYPWYVLVEAEESPELDAWLSDAVEKNYAEDGMEARSSEEAKRIWKIREGIAESLGRIAPYHKNDISVPVAALEAFLAEYQTFFQSRFSALAPYTFGHIGDGNLHINTLNTKGLSAAAFADSVKEFDEALYALVKKHGGTISGEHGVGLLKKKHLGFTRSPEELRLMREIKKVFDPHNLLNPGKVLNDL